MSTDSNQDDEAAAERHSRAGRYIDRRRVEFQRDLPSWWPTLCSAVVVGVGVLLVLKFFEVL